MLSPPHRLDGIDFLPPARFLAVCSCGWRTEPVHTAGLAGAIFDRHVEEVAPAAVEPTALAAVDAAELLFTTLVPTVKEAVREGESLAVIDDLERLKEAAAVLGEREGRLAATVRREWVRLIEDPSSRQRATVLTGLVELGEMARRHLARLLPVEGP